MATMEERVLKNSGYDNKSKITRKKHTKSKVGCPQCRIKKVKCDESLPACTNCVNKSIRCGYLDYDARQIELVRLAHWEAEGSEPGKIPIQAQEYNPTKPLVVMNKAPAPPPIEYSVPHYTYAPLANMPPQQDYMPPQSLPNVNVNVDVNVNVNNHIPNYPPYPPYPAQPPHPPLPLSDQNYFPYMPQSSNYIYNQPFPQHIQRSPQQLNNTSPHSSSLGYTPLTQRTESSSDLSYKEVHHRPSDLSEHDGTFYLPLVEHKMTKVPDDFDPYPNMFSYFNESSSNKPVLQFVLTFLLYQITYTFDNASIFNSSLIWGIGPFLSSHPELDSLFLKFRGTLIKNILRDLPNVNDSNSIGLFMQTISLDMSTVYIQGEMQYTDQFKLSMGSISILRKVFENPSNFPKTFPFLKIGTDCILSSAKSVWIPQYSHKSLFEFLDVVQDFGEEFIDDSNPQLSKKFEELVSFIEYCIDLFENEKSSGLVLRYPVNRLFELYRRWFAIFPSECSCIDLLSAPAAERIFYVLWIALLKQLESMVNCCRYVFFYFFDGFFFLYPFDRELIDMDLRMEGSQELQWYLNYACRLISFFNRRMVFAMGNTMLNDPIPVFLEIKERYKARPLDIHEKYITNFKTTVIKKIHYPIESTNPSANGNQNYFKTSDILDEFQLETLDVSQSDDSIDLYHDINPETSLLNNDHNPSFAGVHFTFQETQLELIDRYMEDRKLVVYQSVDTRRES